MSSPSTSGSLSSRTSRGSRSKRRNYTGRVYVFTEKSPEEREALRKLKETFAQCGIDIDRIDISNKPYLKKIMIEMSNGKHTSPQIFLNETHLGGTDDVMRLWESGKLQDMVSEAKNRDPGVLSDVHKRQTELFELPDTVFFPPPTNRPITFSFNLVNKCSLHTAYRIKTTNPQRFVVKPRNGFIRPEGSEKISISLQRPPDGEDKFRIEGVLLASVPSGVKVDNVFEKVEPKHLVKQKMDCSYNHPPPGFKVVQFNDGILVEQLPSSAKVEEDSKTPGITSPSKDFTVSSMQPRVPAIRGQETTATVDEVPLPPLSPRASPHQQQKATPDTHSGVTPDRPATPTVHDERQPEPREPTSEASSNQGAVNLSDTGSATTPPVVQDERPSAEEQLDKSDRVAAAGEQTSPKLDITPVAEQQMLKKSADEIQRLLVRRKEAQAKVASDMDRIDSDEYNKLKRQYEQVCAQVESLTWRLEEGKRKLDQRQRDLEQERAKNMKLESDIRILREEAAAAHSNTPKTGTIVPGPNMPLQAPREQGYSILFLIFIAVLFFLVGKVF